MTGTPDQDAPPALLRGCDRPLHEVYDTALLDLDGVVYVGGRAVPGAPEHLSRVRARGQRLAFITNNASRPPEAVAEHLTDLFLEGAIAREPAP